MEKTFVYKNGKIKVTYNESSMLKDYDDKYVIKEYRHRTKSIANSYSIEITIVKPTGGKIGYGMLGAMVHPADKQGVVNVSISYTNSNTVRFSDSIIGDDEYVFKGLPKEYLDAVEYSVVESFGGFC